jgi:hypothetical protein
MAHLARGESMLAVKTEGNGKNSNITLYTTQTRTKKEKSALDPKGEPHMSSSLLPEGLHVSRR